MLRHLLPLLLVGLATADDVLELVDSDFDSKLADIETALVMFYAPWWVKKSQFHRYNLMLFWPAKSHVTNHSSSLISDSSEICLGAATASVLSLNLRRQPPDCLPTTPRSLFPRLTVPRVARLPVAGVLCNIICGLFMLPFSSVSSTGLM